jgi:hypothetical protein
MTDSTTEAVDSSLPPLRWAPPPVYYFHIPKTAGSSLRKLLISAYLPWQTAFVHRWTIGRYTSGELGRLRCVITHAGGNLLPYVAQQGLQTVTMLRDPVERVISHIHFQRAQLRLMPHLFDKEFIEKYARHLHSDLHTWLNMLEEDGLFLRDLQVKQLGWMSDLRSFFREEDRARGNVPTQSEWNRAMSTPVTNAAVVAERAHRRLEQMTVVGITENFAASAELVCDLLGMPIPREIPRENIGHQRTGGFAETYRETTPPDIIARIEAANVDDRELYVHARERFAQQLARLRARKTRTISVAAHLCAQMWRIARRVRRAASVARADGVRR